MFTNIFLSADNLSRSKNSSTVQVKLNNEKVLEFPVTSILQRKKKEDFVSPRQNELINRYVDYKGDEFKNKLFEAYTVFYDYLENVEIVNLLPGKKNKVLDYFLDILDLLDYEDIRLFLVNHVQIEPPKDLKEVFNMQDNIDGVCSKEQTFLKEDYIQLVTVIVIVKATYFLLALYSSKIGGTMNMSTRDYSLFKFYQRSDKFFYSPGMVKLLQFTEKLIETKTPSDEEKNIRIIDKVISDDEMSIFNLAQIVFQKLTLADVVNDTKDVNIVTMLYTFLTNKLRETGNTNKIREKVISGGGEYEMDADSYVENHRAVQETLQSDIVHINYATDSMEKILIQLSPEMRELITKPVVILNRSYTLEELRKEFEYYRDTNIPVNIFRILEIIFKGMLDPRAIEHLELDNILCMLTISFAYLWNLDFRELAIFMGSANIRREDNFLSINVTSGKTRIDKEIMNKLIEIFPTTKTVSKTNSSDFKDEDEFEIKRWIENFGNDFYKSDWYFVLGEEMAKLLGLDDKNVSVPEDIKVIIANFLIKNEDIVYRAPVSMEELLSKRPRIKG